MYDVILFGGTTEGRMLAEYLSEAGVNALVCVATSYGDSLLECKSNITVHSGRLDELQMLELFTTECPKLVLDATHPYADIVTKNIRAACEKAGCQYVRIKRESIETEGCACFTSMDELIVWLNQTKGIIFSAMGAKEAAALCKVEGYRERMFLRLLPSAQGIAECATLGYPPKHLICMQGPFSEEFNGAQFREAGANILITKESGAQGGFMEKIAAAKSCGMSIGVLMRPEQTEGLSPVEAMDLIRESCL